MATLKELLHVREGEKVEFDKVAFSPDGKMVMALVGTRTRWAPSVYPSEKCVTDTIKLWDIGRAKEILTMKGQSAQFLQDGKSLLINDSGRRTAWNISAGRTDQPTLLAPPSRARSGALTADNTAKSIGANKWTWTVFIRGNELDLRNISCVEYTLHPTFRNPVRLICHWENKDYPFSLSATGWGTFPIGIRVFMKYGTRRDLKHQLKF